MQQAQGNECADFIVIWDPFAVEQTDERIDCNTIRGEDSIRIKGEGTDVHTEGKGVHGGKII